MAAEATDPDIEDDAPKKKSALMPLIVGVVLALLLGGGGFFAVYSGMILGPSATAEDGHATEGGHGKEGDGAMPLPDVVFLPLEPIVVSLGSRSGSRYLRFRGELEVEPKHEAEVTALMPRILDTLNGYLRAVSVSELEDSASLLLLRAQMLRRIQIIVGDGPVHDLLIIEFVLS